MEDFALATDIITKAFEKDIGHVKANGCNIKPSLRKPSNKNFETKDISPKWKKGVNTVKNITIAINKCPAIYTWPSIKSNKVQSSIKLDKDRARDDTRSYSRIYVLDKARDDVHVCQESMYVPTQDMTNLRETVHVTPASWTPGGTSAAM